MCLGPTLAYVAPTQSLRRRVAHAQSARCFWSRTFGPLVYYECEQAVPASLVDWKVVILECPSEDWRHYLPTKLVFAMLDSYVTKYVKGGVKKAVTNHRERGGTKVGNQQPQPVHAFARATLARVACLLVHTILRLYPVCTRTTERLQTSCSSRT